MRVVPTLRDPAHERFVYINEAKMLNKNVFGRHEKGIRDRGSPEHLAALEDAEKWDTAFVYCGILDKDQRDLLIDDMLVLNHPDLDLEKTLPEPVKQKQLPVKITVPAGQTVLFEIVGEAA